MYEVCPCTVEQKISPYMSPVSYWHCFNHCFFFLIMTFCSPQVVFIYLLFLRVSPSRRISAFSEIPSKYLIHPVSWVGSCLVLKMTCYSPCAVQSMSTFGIGVEILSSSYGSLFNYRGQWELLSRSTPYYKCFHYAFYHKKSDHVVTKQITPFDIDSMY